MPFNNDRRPPGGHCLADSIDPAPKKSQFFCAEKQVGLRNRLRRGGAINGPFGAVWVTLSGSFKSYLVSSPLPSSGHHQRHSLVMERQVFIAKALPVDKLLPCLKLAHAPAAIAEILVEHDHRAFSKTVSGCAENG
jgi:hypothetical protein